MSNITIRKRPSTAAHLLRPRPQDDGRFERWVSDDNRFFVYVHVDVLEFIKSEARLAMPNETIGLLAGRVCEDPQTGPYTIIVTAENARPGEFEASPAHVRLRESGQSHVRVRLEDAHPDREIVGWYHTHPGYPSEFSSVDIEEQKTWSDQHHVGIVYSTSDRREPFGVYRSSDAIRLCPLRSNRNRTLPPAVESRRSVTVPPQVQLRPAAATLPPSVQLQSPTRVAPPVESPIPAPVPADLTPRQGPLDAQNSVLTKAPAALSRRIQIVIMIVMAIVIMGQLAYIFRLDRRASFSEGRLQEMSASHTVLARIAEQLATQPSLTPAPATTHVGSATRESDGPDLRIPSNPLKPEAAPRQQAASPVRRAANNTQSRARQNANNSRRPEKAAQKPNGDKGNAKTSPAPATSQPKPERTPQ